ncbi:MAG TPA: VWA domain-containing protein [Cellulomonas sp.]
MSSGLVWPWALAAVVVVLLTTLLVAVLRRRRRTSARAAADRWVAATADLDVLPEVQTALRRYVWLRAVGVVALAVAVLAAGLLVARPAERQIISDRLGTRDIVLCLDVSGSMVPYDAAVLRSVEDLLDSFQGERVALAVFNSTTRTVIPLTDDYGVVREELEAGAVALEGVENGWAATYADLERYEEFTAGTLGMGYDQASLIGDGLASCSLLFDEEGSDRSRSIVLVTDNELLGDPVYTLQQAADLAASRDITLFGLFGGASDLRGTSLNREFDSAVQGAGGRTWFADDAGVVEEIVVDVMAQQAVDLDAAPEVRVTDRPTTWFVVLLLALGAFLVLTARVRG